MSESSRRFKADLEKFAQLVDVGIEKAVRKVALDIFTATVKRTPVDKGSLRASWTIGVNTVSSDRVDVSSGKLSKAGASTIANQQKSKLSKYKIGDVINITNNQPYALVVEYGMFRGDGPKITSEGYSTQAPKGMLRKSLQEIEAGISEAIREFERIRG